MQRICPEKEFPIRQALKPGFHLQMLYASSALLIIDIAGCKLTHVLVGGIAGTATMFAIVILFVIVMVLAGAQALPASWNAKRKMDLRDAALTIPWAILLFLLLGFTPDIAARLGMGLDLQDAHFAHLDQLLGVSVPGTVSWASRHWLGHMANMSYSLLGYLITISILLPALTGKVKRAQQVVTANVVAFAVGIPLFGLLPAIGPWHIYQFVPSAEQAKCQSDVLLVRQPSPYWHHASNIVCFPSFHVAWAVVCVWSLWAFRPLRIPAAVLSGLIIFSTMTTGWHYFCDVLGGLVIAALAIVAAKRLSRLGASSQECDVNSSSEQQPVSVV